MANTSRFTVRPLTNPKIDVKDSFRVHLSSSALQKLKAQPGDVVTLQVEDRPPQTALIWLSTEPKLTDSVVQTSRVLQQTYGISLQDKVTISKLEGPEPAAEITMEEVDDGHSGPLLSGIDKVFWQKAIGYQLTQIGCFAINMTLYVELLGDTRQFRVTHVKGGAPEMAFKYTPMTKISFEPVKENLELDFTGVGALETQLDALRSLVRKVRIGSGDKKTKQIFPSYQVNRGVLLYGPKGTGKSLVLRRIESCAWRRVIRCSLFKDVTAVARIFAEAVAHQPSLITIESLDLLAPNNTESSSSTSHEITNALVDGFEQTQDAQVLVVATARHPNLVAESLRVRRRLGKEMEFPVPTKQDRLQILRAIRGKGPLPSDEILATIADRTHAYVGADLYDVFQTLAEKSLDRLDAHLDTDSGLANGVFSLNLEHGNVNGSEKVPTISAADVEETLKEIRPTAMQEVFIETPNVRWSDIGGQHGIKELLKEAVDMSLESAAIMKSLNLAPTKGVLLYGPPGCSKTLLVKALATEASLNFLAVKGAELLSMYVGESERAVREVFRKARAASPSILFFDEIDAIASERGGARTHGGLNVLTTLLNEMDGFEEMRNVLVVAATNKPESIDKALMRPGRFDNVLYVGPPDLDARVEIFRSWLRKSEAHPDVDIRLLADWTEGFSGAELVNICQTAGKHVLKERKAGHHVVIEQRHLDIAVAGAKRGITKEVIEGFKRWSSI